MTQPAPAADEILRLEDISLTYPNGTVGLQQTNLHFREGEFTVLLGLSGAGKSSLLRTMNLLIRPSAGRVVSARHGVLQRGRLIRLHRRQTALIFQHHQLIQRFTALQNTLTGRLAHYSTLRGLFPLPKQDIALAYECLERVGLADKAFTRIDNLSGGQMQRVGIARALAQQPDIILADEPVASLDPNTSRKVLGLLQDICRENRIAAIVSLHQLELAKEFADRIVGLSDGRVIYDGRGDSLDAKSVRHIYANTPAAVKSEPDADPVMQTPIAQHA